MCSRYSDIEVRVREGDSGADIVNGSGIGLNCDFIMISNPTHAGLGVIRKLQRERGGGGGGGKESNIIS